MTESCPCIDSSQILAQKANCVVDEATSEQGVLFQDACLPVTFGSSVCAAHDMGVDPRCIANDNKNTSTPEFCGQEWCYVDYEACRMAPEQVYRSSMFNNVNDNVQLYYSYSVCNSSADYFLDYQTTELLNGVTLRATIPVVRDKGHFKLTSNDTLADSRGPEYYDDTVPWQGYMIDYMDAVVQMSNMAGVQYTYRTVGADALGYDPFSGVVHDVSAGLTDVAFSTFWITADRLQMTPYTTPVYVDQVLMWVPQPETHGGGLKENIIHIFAPFDVGLWICLFVLIFLTACVNIWLSTTRGVHSYLSKRTRGSRWKNSTTMGKAKIVGGMVLDSLMIFSTYFFGHSVELDWQSTRAQKVLMFGFAFLILIAVASYTANLAAFLTVTGVSSYISSMEEAIYTNTPICIHPQLRTELESVWPAATFVVNTESSNTTGMITNFEAGKCSVLASSMLEIRQSESLMEAFCNNELVSTGALVLENPIAFPVNEEYAGGLSYWLFRAEKQGITLQSFIDAGVPPLQCNLRLSVSDTESELASLSVENFALPMITCALCIALSIIMHFYFNKPHGSTEMHDVSHNTVESVSPRLQRVSGASAQDPVDVADAKEELEEEQRDRIMMMVGQTNGVGAWGRESIMEIGGGTTRPLQSNGVGAWGRESIMEIGPSGGLKGVGYRNDTTADACMSQAEMQQNMQELLANQRLLLSLVQGKHDDDKSKETLGTTKEEDNGKEPEHAKNE